MTTEEAMAFEEDGDDKYADLNELFLDYDPDSSEIDSQSIRGEHEGEIYILLPKESDVSVEFNYAF